MVPSRSTKLGMMPWLLRHPLEPRVHVLDDPLLVLGRAVQQVGVGRQRRRDQIQEVIADDVAVLLVVRQELLERRLAVQRVEPLDVERIADPVERRRLPQHRPAAAVLHAADDLVGRIVVGRLGILAHVEAGEPPGALLVLRVHRDRQAHAVEELQTLAVVHPVGLDDELLVVHPLARDRHVGGLRLRCTARSVPSWPLRNIWRTSSLAPSACSSGQ